MASSLLLEILRTEPPDWTRAWQVMENHRHRAHGLEDERSTRPACANDAGTTSADSQLDPSLAHHVDAQGRSLLHHAITSAIHQKQQIGSHGSSVCADATASICEVNQDEQQAQEQNHQIHHQRLLLLSLLEQNPEATAQQTLNGKYTPLHCAVQSVHLDCLERDSIIVKMLLQTNPAAVLLKTNDCNHHRRLTPLALHIVTVSNLMRMEEERRSERAINHTNDEKPPPNQPSKALLQALLPCCTLHQLEEAVEILYECNTTLVMSTWMEQERRSHENRLLYGRQTRAVQINDSCWVWDWAMTLFKAVHVKHQQPKQPVHASSTLSTTMTHPQQLPFRALHAAARITDCPIPFLLMALRSHPTQVRLPNATDHGNLPLHTVAQWSYTAKNHCSCSTTSSSTCRKSMALTELVMAHRKALLVQNALGLTPMQLETESGAVIE